MNNTSKDLDHLIELMAKLPGLGPRSARRAVLHMIKKRALLMTPLADVLAEVATTVRECLTCGNIGTSDTCDICTSPNGPLAKFVWSRMFQIFGRWSALAFSRAATMSWVALSRR